MKRNFLQMKKIYVPLGFLLLFAGFSYAQENTVTFDEGIKGSMSYLVERLSVGTKVAVLNFSADEAVSDYVIEELTAFLVNDGNLVVVERSELELLQKEMDFQLSGDVSDESAQSIGKILGAQTVISGSLTPLGTQWRMRIKALEVETAKIQGVQTYAIKKDALLTSLLPKTPKAPKAPKTTGEKVQTGALNLLFGIGSYLDGDISGGLTLTAGFAVGAALVATEILVLHIDDPFPAGNIGVGVLIASAVYGFARPFLYNNKTQSTLGNILSGVNIAVVPDDNGINALGLSYTYHY